MVNWLVIALLMKAKLSIAPSSSVNLSLVFFNNFLWLSYVLIKVD